MFFYGVTIYDKAVKEVTALTGGELRIQDYRNSLVAGDLALSAFAMVGGTIYFLISWMGCCTACCKCCCGSCPLGFFAFVFGVTFFALGGGIYMFQDLVYPAVCTPALVTDVRSQYQPYVDELMCSDQCPCENRAFAQGKWDSIGLSTLAGFLREPTTGNDPNLKAFYLDTSTSSGQLALVRAPPGTKIYNYK